MKRAISLVLVTAMIIAALPISAFAGTGQDGCVIGAKDIFAMAGQSVCVEVEIQGNPGIQGASLCLEWDVGLTLESAENGKAFQMLDLTLPGRLVSGKNFIWYRQAPVTAEDIEDGTILKLNFRVSAQAENGSKFQVRASYNDGDIFGPDLQPVSVALKTGTIRVVSYRPGDVDGNDRLNPMDLVLLSRYIADGCVTDPEGYNVTLNPNAGDVNDDGRLNPLDLVLTSRYIADGCVTDPEGYNVTLKPPRFWPCAFPDSDPVSRGDLYGTGKYRILAVQRLWKVLPQRGGNGAGRTGRDGHRSAGPHDRGGSRSTGHLRENGSDGRLAL